VNDIAEALILGRAFIGGRRGGGEPALVDAAAVGAERIDVLRRQLDAPAGHQEGARHPGGGQPQQSFAGLEGRANDGGSAAVRSGALFRLAWGGCFLGHAE